MSSTQYQGSLLIESPASINLATRFKIGMYLLNKKKRYYNVCPRSETYKQHKVSAEINIYNTSFKWIENR